MRYVYETADAEGTKALGRALGALLTEGAVVSLDGDLGAGKTVLTKGIAAGMGLDPEDVVSPTFAIVNEYRREGALPLYHFDTYRLEGSDDFLASGLDEYFGFGGVCVIEWGEVISDILPADTMFIRITGTGDTRKIETEGAPYVDPDV